MKKVRIVVETVVSDGLATQLQHDLEAVKDDPHALSYFSPTITRDNLKSFQIVDMGDVYRPETRGTT